jgi:hypothetical protein
MNIDASALDLRVLAVSTAERCPVCTVREPSDEPHECPFNSEIRHSRVLCRCCASCAYQCAMGV